MKSSSPHYPLDALFDEILDGLAYCEMLYDDEQCPVNFVYKRVNKNFTRLTGLDNVLEKKITDIFPDIAVTNPELLETYGRVALSGKPERFETYITLLEKWFLVSVYSPKKHFFLASFQDISRQKQIEKNLKNTNKASQNVLDDLRLEKTKLEIAEAKEKALLLSIGDGLIATDKKGRITLMNKKAEEMLGLTEKNILGKYFSRVIDISDEQGISLPVEKRPMHLALTTKTTTEITPLTSGSTYFYIHKNKTRFPVAIMVTPVLLSGEIIGTIEVFRDITEEKEIEKAKNEFISLASHQLRTPATAINWYSEMLLDEEVGHLNTKQQEYLQEIRSGNQRMIDLVNSLLNVSRIELGSFTIQPTPTNLPVLADTLLKELQPEILEKKLVLNKEYETDFPVFISDTNLVRIVIQNLLSNAVTYTPPKGNISIAIKKGDQALILQVSDTGCGIPKEAQSKIYTKFFRADNARSLKSDGNGLGLYITKSIVEALCGTIQFTSEEGSTVFTVTLPLQCVQKRASTKELI